MVLCTVAAGVFAMQLNQRQFIILPLPAANQAATAFASIAPAFGTQPLATAFANPTGRGGGGNVDTNAVGGPVDDGGAGGNIGGGVPLDGAAEGLPGGTLPLSGGPIAVGGGGAAQARFIDSAAAGIGGLPGGVLAGNGGTQPGGGGTTPTPGDGGPAPGGSPPDGSTPDTGTPGGGGTDPGGLPGPGTGAVPEPASWALMILGIAFVGGSLRLRRAPGRFGQVRRAAA